ncbi:hypothetical protein GCM10008959_09050 [Deinococcus seoulensis]|uniref:DUF3558 domain-containing protein n=1 Tax=Deinococcus seoulensis TaxID=1837379 RepID=A0ABQ2RR75_9DEIO|nr:hypothetical protein [Deinococcus seoulensis]GGR50107.1 hypothetical protein GCM10008959_09050 [Deinococcus seoulensis]
MPARAFPALLAPVLLTLLALSGRSAALIVPITGWTPLNGDANFWADPSGQCVMREERHGQAFPQFTTPDDARSFAVKLQSSLGRSVSNVVTQPVDRAGNWGVLAAYDYQQAGVKYRVSQLYLSDRGVLRTVTGSSAAQHSPACVSDMRDFIRYLAN